MARKLSGQLRRGKAGHDWEKWLDGSAYEVTKREVGDLIRFERAARMAAFRRNLSITVRLDADRKVAQFQAFPRET